MGQNGIVPAKEIAEALLEQTGDALAAGDFATFLSAFHLPHTIKTWDAQVLIESEEHLRNVFDNVRKANHALGAKQMVRFVDRSDYRSEHMIVSTHISQAMDGTRRIGAPYPVLSIIEQFDGVWKATSSDYAVQPRSPHERALLSPIAGTPNAEPPDAKD